MPSSFDISAALPRRDRAVSFMPGTLRHLLEILHSRLMSDLEKFEAFKENLVKENKKKYGEEVQKKYGEEEAKACDQKLLNMSEAEYKRFKNLEEDIKRRLEKAVKTGCRPDGREHLQYRLINGLNQRIHMLPLLRKRQKMTLKRIHNIKILLINHLLYFL